MRSSDQSSDVIPVTSTSATAGAKEIADMVALRAALQTYGRHRKWCQKRKLAPSMWATTDACSCGLDAALRIAEYAETDATLAIRRAGDPE